MSQLKKHSGRIIAVLVMVGILLLLSPVGKALATADRQISPGKWTGVCISGPRNNVPTIMGTLCLIANVSTSVFTLLGFGGLVMLIVGGFRYMLSGGSSKGVESAKSSITGVIIGLILALSSFLIINLLSAFTGMPLGQLYFPPGAEGQEPKINSSQSGDGTEESPSNNSTNITGGTGGRGRTQEEANR